MSEHTILNMDSLDALREMPDASADLIVTDPPYGINYKSGMQGVDRKASNASRDYTVVRKEYFAEIRNDDAVPVAWLPEAYRVLRPNTAIYVFGHWKTWGALSEAVVSAGFVVRNMIVMRKSNHGMGDLTGSFAPKHELLLYAAKGKHKLNTPPRLPDVWDVPVRFTGAHRLHPNEKPLSWMEPAILSSSCIGGLVIDPFCGSGSTGAAALKHGRNFIGIELDPEHAATAWERLADISEAA